LVEARPRNPASPASTVFVPLARFITCWGTDGYIRHPTEVHAERPLVGRHRAPVSWSRPNGPQLHLWAGRERLPTCSSCQPSAAAPRPRPLPVRATSPESTLSQGRAGDAGMRKGRARLGLDQRARLAEPHGRHAFLHQPPVYPEEEIMSWDAS